MIIGPKNVFIVSVSQRFLLTWQWFCSLSNSMYACIGQTKSLENKNAFFILNNVLKELINVINECIMCYVRMSGPCNPRPENNHVLTNSPNDWHLSLRQRLTWVDKDVSLVQYPWNVRLQPSRDNIPNALLLFCLRFICSLFRIFAHNWENNDRNVAIC